MKLLRKLFYILITVTAILLGFQILRYYNSMQPPFDLDRHSQNVLLTPYEIEKGFSLVYFLHYPETDYLIAKFIRQEHVENLLYTDRFSQTDKIIFVNVKKNQRVLAVEHDTLLKDGQRNTWHNSSYQIYNPQFTRIGNEVVYLFAQSQSSRIDLPFRINANNTTWTISLNDDYDEYAIASNGKLINDIYAGGGALAVPGTNAILQGIIHTPFDKAPYINMMNLSSENGIKMSPWTEPFPSDKLIYFGNHVYLGYSKTNLSSTIYIDDGSFQYRAVDFQELVEKRNTQFFQTYYPLTTGRYNQPAMILITTNLLSFYVYEINTNNILHGNVKEIFSELYQNDQNPPFTVMNQNQVLMFQSDDINLDYEILKNTGKLYFALREKNEDGTDGKFNKELHEIDVLDSIELISKYPYDDTHLLMYGGNAVWTMKWDGTELQQVFPAGE